jgi:drug/metabolite transporter (DMT)-like permease
LALSAGLAWGGGFPVFKSALPSLGPFYLATIRYALAALLFLAILLLAEGRGALRFEGRFRQTAALGAFGFTGFNLLVLIGLAHTQPQSGALIVATMPLLTALVLWLRKGVRPARATLSCMALALAGVALVISRGSLSYLASGQMGYGDLLILLGTLCWVIYTMEAASYAAWSPLRFTALSALGGRAASR